MHTRRPESLRTISFFDTLNIGAIFSPNRVFPAISFLSMSPVLKCGMFFDCANMFPSVPLPLPGGPSKTRRIRKTSFLLYEFRGSVKPPAVFGPSHYCDSRALVQANRLFQGYFYCILFLFDHEAHCSGGSRSQNQRLVGVELIGEILDEALPF